MGVEKLVQIIISGLDKASPVFAMIHRNVNFAINDMKSQITTFGNHANTVFGSLQSAALPATGALVGLAMAGNNLAQTAFRAEMGGKMFATMLQRVGENATKVMPQVAALADYLKLPEEVLQQNAVELLRNSYSWQQIIGIYMGAAASGTLVGKSTTESVQKITEALITQQSVILNQVGIVQNLNTAYQKYAKANDTTVDKLTDAQRAEAGYQMILQATAQEVKDLPKIFEGYGGAVADSTREMYDAKVMLGKELMPLYTEMYGKLTNVLHAFNTLSPAQKDFIFDMAGTAVKAIAVASALGLVASAGSVLMKSFSIVGAVISLVTSPMSLSILAIVGAIGLLKSAWDTNWGGIQQKTETVWAAIKPIFDFLAVPAKYVFDVTIQFLGDEFTRLGNALKTGNFGEIFGVTSDLWATGAMLKIGVDLAKDGLKKLEPLKKKIIDSLGLVSKNLGVPGAIGAITIAVQLAEAIANGDFKKFGENMLAGLAAGLGVGFFTKNPKAGAIAFDIVVNLKLGEKVADKLPAALEATFGPVRKAVGTDKSGTTEYKVLVDPAGTITELQKAFDGHEFTLKAAPAPSFFQKVGNFFSTLLAPYGGYPAFHDGGMILPGKSGPDQFLAMLAPGEAVVPAAAVNGGWREVLKWFKQQGVPGFATGKAPASTGVYGPMPSDADINKQIADTGSWLDGLSATFETVGKGILGIFSELSALIWGLFKKIAPEMAGDMEGFFKNVQGIFKTFEINFNKPVKSSGPETLPPILADLVNRPKPAPGKSNDQNFDLVGKGYWDTFVGMLKVDFSNFTKRALEEWSKATDVFANAKEWLGKPWAEKIADIKEAVGKVGIAGKDVVGKTATGLAGAVLQNAPVANAAMQGFTSGGLAGGLTAILTQSKTFAQLMENINPILQMVADTFGLILEPLLPVVNIIGQVLAPILSILGTLLSSVLVPLMKPLFGGLKILGIATSLVAAAFYGVIFVGRKVGEGLMTMIAWIFKVLPGFDSLEQAARKQAQQFGQQADEAAQAAKDQLQAAVDLTKLTYDEATARSKNTEELNNATEALKNVPQGYLQAISTFRAADRMGGVSGTASFGAASYSPMAAANPIPSFMQSNQTATSSQRIDINVNMRITVAGTGASSPDIQAAVRKAAEEGFRQGFEKGIKQQKQLRVAQFGTSMSW